MVGEVVRDSWRLFLERFWRTLLIVALLLAPLELLIAIFDPDFGSLALGWWAWVAATSAVTLVAFPWVIGAVVHDIAEADRTATDPYRRTVDRLPDLVLSALVTTIGILLGTIALIVPGLILMARWALVVPLIVLERQPWRVALSRSNQLIKGQTGSVVAIFVLLTLIGAVLVAIPVLVGYGVLGGVVGAWVAAMAINTVFIAFYSFAPFILYRRLSR
ncbi:MAG TPA: glycerophosphoryl diester phosphodiesterase membrane domain-containing protein [Gaiellaceae bacterium]|nr:glycerophosphoryl diester phosphodiesterase membrane domain-containing protein [Gaiellaceae bacterium]